MTSLPIAASAWVSAFRCCRAQSIHRQSAEQTDTRTRRGERLLRDRQFTLSLARISPATHQHTSTLVSRGSSLLQPSPSDSPIAPYPAPASPFYLLLSPCYNSTFLARSLSRLSQNPQPLSRQPQTPSPVLRLVHTRPCPGPSRPQIVHTHSHPNE